MTVNLLQGVVLVVACVLLGVHGGPNLPQLVTTTECARYSLDTLYYDKYKPQADAIITDAKNFVITVADKMYESFQQVLMQLPGRDQSDVEEKRLYTSFETMKKTFARKVDKAMKNLTEAWEELLPLNQLFLLGKPQPSRQEMVDKMDRVYDCFKAANATLEQELSMVIIPLKKMILNSALGIQTVFKMTRNASNDGHDHHQHHHNNENATKADQDGDDDDVDIFAEEEEEEVEKPKEENPFVNKTIKDIVEDLVPYFMGKLSERILDDEAEVTLKTVSFREYHLEQLTFDVFMMCIATRRMLNPTEEMDENSTDLTRRNLHMFYLDKADRVFQDKLQEIKDGKKSSLFPMESEEQLLDTMVAMLQRYP